MDLKDVQKLIKLLKKNNLTELTYRNADNEVILKQSLEQPTQSHYDKDSNVHQSVSKDNATPAQSVKSPMVGVFYLAQSPDADPFVKVGSSVKVGDTIGIIEAMKVMTPVKADQSGVVKQILVKDGEEVEYDEPLIQIETTD